MTVVEQERVTFVRTFEAALAEGDGRTIDARIAPYDAPAVVADPPDFRPYREMFVRGAFERQLSVPARVRMWLNFEHEQGLRGIVGHGVALRDEPDGLHGSFRVHENADGDKALQLVSEGLLGGVSLEYAAMRSKTVDGVVQRLRAHIDKVSLCRFPAYAGAEVLAVREQPDDPDVDPDTDNGDGDGEVAVAVPAITPVAWRDGQLERLAALGIEPHRRTP